jgi:hypothetical protein
LPVKKVPRRRRTTVETKVTKLFGMYQRGKQIFVSLNLQHIEIYEYRKLFGITVWDREVEVHVPPLAKLEKDNLQVIYEAYEEIWNVTKELKQKRK